MNVFIKKIITQQVIGYSDDGKETYVENVCLMTDGTRKVMYSTFVMTEHGELHKPYSEKRPYIARPFNGTLIVTQKEMRK